MSIVYERIKELKRIKGVSFSFLNEKIGGYRGKMTDVKNGKVSLTKEELLIIATELQTTPEYLAGETDEKKPTTQTDGEPINWNNLLEGLSQDELKEVMEIAMKKFVDGQKKDK